MDKNITLGEAQRLLQDRITAGHKANKLFLDGDHWQEGEGFPALPPLYVENRQQIIDTIQKAFTSENVIAEIVERHLDGVIAREPDWNLVDMAAAEPDGNAGDGETPQERMIRETVAALVEWWNDRKMLGTLREALSTALIQDKCVVRAYVPPGFVDESGNIQTHKNLSDALKMLQFEVLPADVAGIFYDSERNEPFGIFATGGDDKKVELTFLDKEGNTRLRVFEEQTLLEFAQETLPTIAAYIPPADSEEAPPEIQPLKLDGNLLMFELSRSTLIDEQVRSQQKQVNLTWTMGGKNIVIAGSRERYFINSQRPKKTVKRRGTDGSTVETTEDAPLQIGGSSATFLGGSPIYQGTEGEQRKLVGYATANVVIVDPVQSDVFDKRRDKLKMAMLGRAKQSHVQLNDMTDASGISKQEGRAEFEKSLKTSKSAADPLGRWILEVGLLFAAAHTTGGGGATREKEFENFRVDFNAIVDAGAVDPEQVKVDREDVDSGYMSVETYHARRGIEDPDAEVARLQESEFYQLSLMKKRLEVANLAKNVGLPNDEILKIAGYRDDAERKQILDQMTVVDSGGGHSGQGAGAGAGA
ncbi:MAG TPA: hypothetical protein VGC76_14560 [Pyrinomonadaceae bacterium]|jgi:hypothetical protein